MLSPLPCQEKGYKGMCTPFICTCCWYTYTVNLDPVLLFHVISLFLHVLFVSTVRGWRQINVHGIWWYIILLRSFVAAICVGWKLSSTHQCFMCFSKLCLQFMYALFILVLFSFGCITFTLQYCHFKLQLLIQCL